MAAEGGALWGVRGPMVVCAAVWVGWGFASRRVAGANLGTGGVNGRSCGGAAKRVSLVDSCGRFCNRAWVARVELWVVAVVGVRRVAERASTRRR